MALIVRQWTSDHLEKLKELADKGASLMRRAVALKRNQSAVKKQARVMGLSIPGLREVKAASRARIAEAEQGLKSGTRKFDGSFAE